MSLVKIDGKRREKEDSYSRNELVVRRIRPDRESKTSSRYSERPASQLDWRHTYLRLCSKVKAI